MKRESEKDFIAQLKDAQKLAQSAEYDSALKILNAIEDTTRDSSVRIDSLNVIGNIHFYQGDYADSLSFYQRALMIAKEMNNLAYKSSSYMNIARVYYEWSHYDQALSILEECLKLQKQEGSNDTGLIDVENYIAKVYWRKGDYKKAIEISESTERKARELNYLKGLQSSFNTRGNIYLLKGDYAKSLEYYNKSMAIRQKLGDKISISNMYNNLARLYKNTGDLDQSFEYIKKGLEMKIEVGDKRGLGISYHEL
ncbi:MAG: tetratricopeptide repeat protein, partial [Candidatus Hodarchaeales archaeon]